MSFIASDSYQRLRPTSENAVEATASVMKGALSYAAAGFQVRSS